MFAYFVARLAPDGKAAEDLKSIKSAENLFICGHIQNLEISTGEEDSVIYIRGKCLPEMHKDRIYGLQLALSAPPGNLIKYANCGCPAGHGSQGSCKHIAALCYALIDFTRFRTIPELSTPTDRLQQWNHPQRQDHLEIIPVNQLGHHRRELLNFKLRRGTRSGVVFDPQPFHGSSVFLERLRCNLQDLNQSCGLLHILLPDQSKIDHDHSYSRSAQPPAIVVSSDSQVSSESCINVISLDEDAPVVQHQAVVTAKEVLEDLHVTNDERMEFTWDQSNSYLWHKSRQKRITGSKCGRILIQHKETEALLRFCLYPKPMIHLPKPIAWGKENKENARKAYTSYMLSQGHDGLKTRNAGFIVHDDKPWLGASPDAWVTDPSVSDSEEIVEFKCPFVKADMTVLDACKDPEFCCTMSTSSVHSSMTIQLKRHHTYYDQVQLQLYVAHDLCSWRDFCIYTTRRSICTKLDLYFFNHILPEIISPKCKPSYYL